MRTGGEMGALTLEERMAVNVGVAAYKIGFCDEDWGQIVAQGNWRVAA